MHGVEEGTDPLLLATGRAGNAYQENRWAVAEGQRLYNWFNCVGCHAAAGGGAIGPAFTDEEWIYGSDPASIFTTIVEGRPEGMPAYGGRVSAADVWKLTAYVRSLGRLTPPDVWPARADQMSGTTPQVHNR